MSFKLIERVIIFWNNNKTNPIPNSIAENTKKKNVNESMFILSLINPTNNTIVYKVIQSSSAVNNRCKAVLVFTITLNNIKKKKKKSKFKLSTVILIPKIRY